MTMVMMPFVCVCVCVPINNAKKGRERKEEIFIFQIPRTVPPATNELCVTYIRMHLSGEQMIRVPLASCATPSVISLLEHIICRWIQHPIASFARTIDATIFTAARRLVARHFDEAIVQREIVANRILPSLFILTIVWESARRTGLEQKTHANTFDSML